MYYISLSSILLNDKDVIKLSGFSFCRELKEEYSETMTTCGTYAYMAPEVMRQDRTSKKVGSFLVLSWNISLGACFCSGNKKNKVKPSRSMFLAMEL